MALFRFDQYQGSFFISFVGKVLYVGFGTEKFEKHFDNVSENG